MRAQEFILKGEVDEMALSRYQTIGDFERPGPFRGPDKRLVPHKQNQLKAARFFEKTPYNFRLFFGNIPGTGRFSEHGRMLPNQVRNSFSKEVADQLIDGSQDAITVLFVGNRGVNKVPMTPWIMAHRFGHAVQAGVPKNRAWLEAERHFFTEINRILDEYYNKPHPRGEYSGGNFKLKLTPEYNALFNAIGTQHSSRSRKIRRPYEFLYELFAQYLGTGAVKLNPLPTELSYGRQAWGRPTKHMVIDLKRHEQAELQNTTEILARDMQILFNNVLADSVGQIFIM